MFTKKVIILIVFSLSSNLFSQQFSFNPIPRKINYYKNIEDSLKSTFIKNKNYHATKYSQPFSFLRNNIKFNPPVLIQYFFTKRDSIVRNVNIVVDSIYFLPNHAKYITNYREKNERLSAFNRIYNSIKSDLIIMFGNPENSTDLFLKKINDEKFSWSREDIWKSDSLQIKMKLTFSDNKTTYGNYKIRTKIIWKENEKIILNTIKNVIQDSIAIRYITLIFIKQFEESWDMLHSDVKQQMTYEDYIKIVESISELSYNDSQEIEQYMSGVQLFSPKITGSYFSYKFKSDRNNQPKILIKVAFKTIDSDKIYGIQPLISQ